MMVGVYHMKNIRISNIAYVISFIGLLINAKLVDAQPQDKTFFALDEIKSAITKINKETPFSKDALSRVKLGVVEIARKAGCSLSDLLVLNSFANRVSKIAEKAPTALSAFGKEFFENILPKHEDAIIEIMQKPEFAPVQELLNEQLETLPQLLETQKSVKSVKSATPSEIEQKMQKLNELINGCQGQLHKLMGILFTIRVYAESISQQSQNVSYQALFDDIKTAALKIAAEHLETIEIDHILRFFKSEAYAKLITRYDELVQVAINALKPGYYQKTALSLWDKAKSYATALVAR